MTTQHTPGPWERDGLTIYALHYSGDYKDGKPLLVNRFAARVDDCLHQGGSKQEAEANARLIAAAPDLLEALQMCIEAPITAHELARARAAIAKAKGGSNGIPA